MKNRRFAILLIIMMLITPVASAFSHCAGMSMHGHASENLNLSVAASFSQLQHFQDHEQNRSDKLCHASGSCTFHVCGGCGITSSTINSNFYYPAIFSGFEVSSPSSQYFPPAIRPPILII